MRGFVPGETSVALERLEAAGAVIFAKTAVPEFCYSGHLREPGPRPDVEPVGPDPCARADRAAGRGRRWPAGSGRSRSAATAAARSGSPPRSAASSGSSRRSVPSPATRARTPGGRSWLVGPLARTVADARLMFAALAGGRSARPPRASTSTAIDQPAPEPTALRVVVCEDLGFVRRSTTTCGAAFRRAVAALGGRRDPVEDDPGIGSSRSGRGPRSPPPRRAARRSEVPQPARRADRRGRRTSSSSAAGSRADEYDTAQAERERIRARLPRPVRADRRVGPDHADARLRGVRRTGRTIPLEIGGEPIHPLWMDWAPFLYDANLCGFPALSLPIGFGDDGLPVGLQVQALPGHDGAVLGGRRDDRARRRMAGVAAGAAGALRTVAAGTAGGPTLSSTRERPMGKKDDRRAEGRPSARAKKAKAAATRPSRGSRGERPTP